MNDTNKKNSKKIVRLEDCMLSWPPIPTYEAFNRDKLIKTADRDELIKAADSVDEIFFAVSEDTRKDFNMSTECYTRYLMRRIGGPIANDNGEGMLWVLLHMNRTYYLYRDFKSIRVIKAALKLRDDYQQFFKENNVEDPELCLSGVNEIYPTILEVFIAVAEYKSSDIGKTRSTFKHMLNNLSLYDIATYNELERHLNNFVFGLYGFDGTGDNVFTFPNFDIRGMDLFDQKKKYLKIVKKKIEEVANALLGGDKNETDQ